MEKWQKMGGDEFTVKIISGIMYIHWGVIFDPLFMKVITFMNRGGNIHPKCMYIISHQKNTSVQPRLS